MTKTVYSVIEIYHAYLRESPCMLASQFQRSEDIGDSNQLGNVFFKYLFLDGWLYKLGGRWTVSH